MHSYVRGERRLSKRLPQDELHKSYFERTFSSHPAQYCLIMSPPGLISMKNDQDTVSLLFLGDNIRACCISRALLPMKAKIYQHHGNVLSKALLQRCMRTNLTSES